MPLPSGKDYGLQTTRKQLRFCPVGGNLVWLPCVRPSSPRTPFLYSFRLADHPGVDRFGELYRVFGLRVKLRSLRILVWMSV